MSIAVALGLSLLLVVGVILSAGEVSSQTSREAVDWPVYAGDAGGRRYSPLAEITPSNVGRLEIAWEYHAGDPQ